MLYRTSYTNLLFCLYLQRLRDEEAQRNREWEERGNTNARAAMIIEREQNRRQRDIDGQMAAENKRLAAEQKDHIAYVDSEVYTNEPTAAYFMQFNTTTR